MSPGIISNINFILKNLFSAKYLFINNCYSLKDKLFNLIKNIEEVVTKDCKIISEIFVKSKNIKNIYPSWESHKYGSWYRTWDKIINFEVS